jgi:hypothetical protein
VYVCEGERVRERAGEGDKGVAWERLGQRLCEPRTVSMCSRDRGIMVVSVKVGFQGLGTLRDKGVHFLTPRNAPLDSDVSQALGDFLPFYRIVSAECTCTESTESGTVLTTVSWPRTAPLLFPTSLDKGTNGLEEASHC